MSPPLSLRDRSASRRSGPRAIPSLTLATPTDVHTRRVFAPCRNVPPGWPSRPAAHGARPNEQKQGVAARRVQHRTARPLLELPANVAPLFPSQCDPLEFEDEAVDHRDLLIDGLLGVGIR